MSTLMRTDIKCGLCGHTFMTRILTSTNAFGSPDLDLRPPQMKRSTMPMWVQSCPKCGYVHSEIEVAAERHKKLVESKEYRECEGNLLEHSLSRNFYRFALISLNENEILRAYDAFLHAAWACDDADDTEGATLCRNKAIALYDTKIFDNPNLTLRHIDILRRAGRFDEALSFCTANTFSEEIMKKVARFQERLCQNKDTACYRIMDCHSEELL